MRWILGIAPLLLTLSIGCPEGGAAFTRTETRSLPLKAGGELRVKGFNGQIRVETWNQEQVEIQAEIRENEQGEVSLVAESKDGRAEIIGERTGSKEHGFHFQFGSAGISYTLKVPASAKAVLETSNGQITVQGLQGSLTANTSNGQVELKQLGADATVHTSNGSVQVETIAGAVDISTSNASVEARSVKGELRIRTSNGSVDAREVNGRTTVRTSNASVTLEAIQAPVIADTSNGSLRAERLSDDLKATTSNASVDLRDVTGRVEVRTSNGRVEARGLNGKDRGIRLQTSHGEISLELDALKGEIRARTSGHHSVDIQRQGLAVSGNTEKGEADITLPGSSQLVELQTSDGDVTIR